MMRSLLYVLTATMLFSCNSNGAGEGKQTATPEKPVPAAVSTSRNIVFFGNSLTAGYGLDPSEAFPALVQKKLDSLGLPYKVVNAGVSGETSAGGLGRIDWILKQPVDVFVLELGANDGLRGISPAETYRNLDSIIDKVKRTYPKARVVLAGMQVPPSMGQRFAKQFADIYPRLATANDVALIPFLLEGVGGEMKLNQEDGIHPTAEGHAILAETVWKVLGDVVGAP